MHKIQIHKITNKRLLRQARPTKSAILKIKKKKMCLREDKNQISTFKMISKVKSKDRMRTPQLRYNDDN